MMISLPAVNSAGRGFFNGRKSPTGRPGINRPPAAWLAIVVVALLHVPGSPAYAGERAASISGAERDEDG